jgi:hypothetical protein
VEQVIQEKQYGYKESEIMAYTKTVWKDRQVEFPNRYKDQNNTVYTLSRDEGVVSEAGTLVNATVMNNIEDGLVDATTHKGCLLYKSTNQTLTTATATNVTWDSEEYDTNDFHSTSSNTSRITIPAGVTKVKLSAMVAFSNSSTTGARYLAFRKNGSDFIGGGRITIAGTSSPVGANLLHIETPVVVVTTGDYFEVRVWQSSGGDLDILATGTLSTTGNYFALEVIE